MTTLLTAPNTLSRPHTGRLARLLAAAQSVATPALLIDPAAVAANYRRIDAAFAHSPIYYAVKANPHPSVLAPLITAGCGMDVASGPELESALALGAPAGTIIFSAPFKSAADIALAHRNGVRLYVADSYGEVDKVAAHAHGSRLLIRVAAGSGSCLTPMGSKFGANPSDVLPLLERARAAGLVPWGLHFHVGSQCLEPDAWAQAMERCVPLWQEAHARGMPLHMLDIGGGFPVRYDRAVPSIEAIAAPTLAMARAHLGPAAHIGLEPGRWMSRGAATLVAEVIGIARRGDEHWVYLDAGVYNGLIDTTEGVVYPMRTPDELETGRRRPRWRVTLAGPSCDGNDVMLRGVEAPQLAIGDRLLFAQAGAYTTSFERFNGLAYPSIVALGEGLDA